MKKTNIFYKISKNLFNTTLIGKLISLINAAKNYITSYNYVAETLYSDELKIVLKRYLHVDFKKDWIGRLYGVINPNIDINGKLDINNIVIELDDNNSNNMEFIKHWTYKQLNLIADLFKINNLYEFVNMQFYPVGPKNSDNFLLVFDLIARVDFAHKLKKFLKHLSVYAIIAAIVLFILYL